MGLTERWKGKGKWLPILGGGLGVLLLLSGSLFTGAEPKRTDTYYEVGFYTDTLEKKIETLCTTIHGITEAEVLLTLDCGTEYVYAKDTAQSDGSYTADYVLLGSGGEAGSVLLLEIYPKIRGIAVVCTGGDEITVRREVTELLSAALGVSSNRIKVTGS